MAPILGYWAIRGLASPIRMMLHYLNVEFEDKQYETVNSANPDEAKQQWNKDKDGLGLEFPNLPYYIDGDLRLTESLAISKHLARKNGLAGDSEADYIRIDVAVGVIMDIGREFAMLCYGPNFEQNVVGYKAVLPTKVEKLAKLLGKGKYLLGDKICWVDFTLFEMLERLLAFDQGCLKGTCLACFHRNFASLPAISKYQKSPSFSKIADRFNGRSASFGAGTYDS